MSSKFSAQADDTILRMRGEGAPFSAITTAVILFGADNITECSVRHRWRWIIMTAEQREARKTTLNARRRKLAGVVRSRRQPDPEPGSGLVVTHTRPSPKLLAERDRRYLIEPRSLTALLLGDPLPGYSALDARETL